jgi:hypothetical protein
LVAVILAHVANMLYLDRPKGLILNFFLMHWPDLAPCSLLVAGEIWGPVGVWRSCSTSWQQGERLWPSLSRAFCIVMAAGTILLVGIWMYITVRVWAHPPIPMGYPIPDADFRARK